MPEKNPDTRVLQAIQIFRIKEKRKGFAHYKNIRHEFDMWEQPILDEWLPDDRIHKAAPGEDRANIRSATPMGFAKAVFEANCCKEYLLKMAV